MFLIRSPWSVWDSTGNESQSANVESSAMVVTTQRFCWGYSWLSVLEEEHRDRDRSGK